MSSLEQTIEEVIQEAADVQHVVPGKGGAQPAAKSSPDEDAPKHSTDAADKAGDATKEAPKTNKAAKQDKGEEADDGETKVDKSTKSGKAVNQEEIDDNDVPSLEEMSKADLLKAAVTSMKEMDAKTLKAHVNSLSEEDDEDDDDEENTSESLSRNALIRKVIESLKDKSIKAQIGIPDMKIPINYALNYPNHSTLDIPSLDFSSISELTFEKPDLIKFKCIDLAYQALEHGGTSTAVLNISNDIAVNLFLSGKIKFTDIPLIIEKSIENHEQISSPTLDDIYNLMDWTNEYITKEVSYAHN